MAVESAVKHHHGAVSRSRGIDARLAELAARQHGVLARRQLIKEGVGRGALRLRLDNGRLHRVHAGVYAVGHPHLSRNGRWMAAVLVGGPGAVLSDRAAAALWQIRRHDARDVDVTVWPSRRPRPGLRFHARRLPTDEITSHDGIPVTTPARTLLDLASVLDRTALERAAHEAEFRRLTSPLSLDDLVDRHAGARGAATIRHLLADLRLGAHITRSELEDRFLAFLDVHDLPRPRVNALITLPGQTLEVDCAWPAERMVVELDGHAAHATARAFERDRARDRALAAAGWRVVRITWRQLQRDEHAITADLRALLGASLTSA